jgi:hypothetical protein
VAQAGDGRNMAANDGRHATYEEREIKTKLPLVHSLIAKGIHAPCVPRFILCVVSFGSAAVMLCHDGKPVRVDLSLLWGDRQKGVAKHVSGTPIAVGAHGDHWDEASPPGPFTFGNSPRQGEAHWHGRSSGESMFRSAVVVVVSFILNNAVAVSVLSLP